MNMEESKAAYYDAIRKRMDGDYAEYKPTVRYIRNGFESIKVGQSAYVTTIDHPSDLVDNGFAVRTSKVLSYDVDSGEFETLNTKYVPA